MFMLKSTLFALLSALVTAEYPRHTLWDATTKIPSTWIQGERAVQESITFHVALKGANVGVESLLERISDPLHADYGKYLTVEELHAKFAAPVAVQQRVELFFKQHGIACNNMGGTCLKCRAKAKLLEAVFHTKMHRFTHRQSRATIVRHTGKLSLPEHVVVDVDFVSGLGQFFHFRRQRVQYAAPHVKSPSVAGCGGSKGQDCFVVPSTIRSLYNVSEDVAAGSSNTSVGVAEFPGNFAILEADLETFGKQVGSKTTPLTINHRGGLPNEPQQQVSEEAQLDIQYTSGLGDGVENWVWNQNNWMYALCIDLQNVSSAALRPSVISMSYAWSEAQQCSGTTGAECQQLGVNAEQYVQRTNQEFAKVGLLGITMMSASGDSGCHGRTEGLCILQKGMKPDYPTSSPYVTSVGGTMLHHGNVAPNTVEPVCGGDLAGQCASGGQEVVSSTGPAGGRISSGGGFAQYSQVPKYQQNVVSKYLANATAMDFAGGQGTLFNAKGRGYPDIAALAHKFYIVMHGTTSSVDGTSASTPTIAGLVGLINSQRIEKGKPVVGFLNPLLYAVHNSTGGAAFNDITVGNNACTEQGCLCKTGFLATPGWDAATGLGTPNVGIMMEAIEALDKEREERVK